MVSYQKTEQKKQSESCDDNLEKLIFQDQERIMLEIKRFLKRNLIELTTLFVIILNEYIILAGNKSYKECGHGL